MEKNKKIIAIILTVSAVFAFSALATALYTNAQQKTSSQVETKSQEKETIQFWFLLKRASNEEILYHGTPGNENQSTRVKTFTVKTGVPGKKPTPLPELVGREYWKIVDKFETHENPETAPYFLQLDVPVSENEPYGPEPYKECEKNQCNWELPGYFGLHGVAGDNTKLSNENEGSSGCIRHSDEDITYLYNTLPIGQEEIRYYIQDV